MAHKKKFIPQTYVEEFIQRLACGERPQKEDDTMLSKKKFLKQVMPYIRSLLAEGYQEREIAKFTKYISKEDLQIAIKEDEESKTLLIVPSDILSISPEDKIVTSEKKGKRNSKKVS